MAKFGISIAVTEESTDQRPQYDDLPAGVYKLELSAVKIPRTNEGTTNETAGFNATFDVVEPEELKGRKTFNYYNLTHPNADAQRIGHEEFSRLRRAIGLGDVDKDMEEEEVVDEMRLVPFIATISMGKDSKKKNADGSPAYPAKMEISRYWYPDLDDAPPIGVTAAAANDNKATAKVVAKPATVAATTKPSGESPWAEAKRKREAALAAQAK